MRAKLVGRFQTAVPIDVPTQPIELVEQSAALLQAFTVHRHWQTQARQRESLRRRIARDEGAVLSAQVGRLGHSQFSRRGDVTGQTVGVISPHLTGNGTEIGMFADGLGRRVRPGRGFAREHEDTTVVVNVDGVVDRANESKLVGHAGLQRVVLANADAGNIGRDRLEDAAIFARSIRLEIVGFQLRGTAHQVEQDDSSIGALGPGRRPRGQHLSKGKPTQSQCSNPKKLSSRHGPRALAGSLLDPVVVLWHDSFPRSVFLDTSRNIPWNRVVAQ